MKKFTAGLLLLCLLVSLAACGRTHAPTEYAVKYHVKINPEFDIYADSELNVLYIEAKNKDAKAVLSRVQAEGKPVAAALSAITEEAKEEGFLTVEKGNTVEMTIDEIDEETFSVCPVCGGGGTVACWDCDRAGKLDCHCDDGIELCHGCNGAKARVCESCGGEGAVSSAPGDAAESRTDPAPADDGGTHLCPDCGGEGWVACEQCGGTGQTPNNCPQCGGTGNCPDCGGTGYVIVTAGDTGAVVYKEDGTPETGRCQPCHGTGLCQRCDKRPGCPGCCEHHAPDGTIRNPGGIPGKTRCNSCGGSGLAEIPAFAEPAEDTERTESGTSAECPDCHGAGSIPCGDCGGTGRQVCIDCGGAGYHICGCELNGYRWCPCCWGSGVDGTGYENYDYSLTPEQNFYNNRD